jgi:thioredoxin-related protein
MKILNLIFTLFFVSSCSSLPRTISDTSVKGTDYVTEKAINATPSKKGQVVIFVSTICPCSASFESEIQRLVNEYGKEFSFIAIHSNKEERYADAKEYFRYVEFPTPVIRDEKLYYANLYGALKTPHAFVISQNGQILYQGGVGESSNGNDHTQELPLRKALSQITKGEAVTTSFSGVFGCSISR